MLNYRNATSKWARKAIQVTILGADTPVGQMTAFLLKQNPLLSHLHLQGGPNVDGIAEDLNNFDTRCTAKAHSDSEGPSKSIKSSDVVVMVGTNTQNTRMSLARLVMAEGKRVVQLAQTCAKFAPKALILVAVSPVSVTLPVVAEAFKQTDWYHPGRIIGTAGLPQLKANAIAGHYQNFDPLTTHVPIVGGPDLSIALPLFTQASPEGVPCKQATALLERFRAEEPLNATATHAAGINRTVMAIARGILGVEGAQTSAFVRSNLITTCRYQVTNVVIGRDGVQHNFGLPKLSHWELDEFEAIALKLQQRDEMAMDLVEHHKSCSLPHFMAEELHEEKIFSEGVIR